MKKSLLSLIILALSASTALSLAPFKVGVFYTGASTTMTVRITDYSGGTNTLYTSADINNVTGNSSGFAILDVVENTQGQNQTALADIQPTDINTSTVVEVLVGGQIYAQYRLDQLLASQAQGGIFDNDGNLTPPENGGSDLGGDEQRWSSAYVLGNSVHIGPADGEANETEMKLSYDENTGTGTIKVDSEEIIDITEDNLTIDGNGTDEAVTIDNAGAVALGVNGELEVSEATELSGALTATAAGNTIGDGTDAAQLTISGSSTNAAIKEFIVNGDVQINGSLEVNGTVAQTPVGTDIGALASVIILSSNGQDDLYTVNDLNSEHSIGSIVHIYQSQNETPGFFNTINLNGVVNDLSNEGDSFIITKTAANTWIFISENDN
jgi:hypothetical protein